MSLKQSVFLLIFFNFWIWISIVAISAPTVPYFDFLSVGQGDSEIISLPSGVVILVDGGPDGKVLSEMEKSFGRRKYIDIIILTHPHADHYVGLAEVIKRYDVGIILMPESENASSAFLEFLKLAEEKGISVLNIGEGDWIISGEMKIRVFSPSVEDNLADMNARSIVFMFEYDGTKAVFTGDAGKKQEERISDLYDIDADILKVSHHGSSGSSSGDFLNEISPAISVIEAGIGNRYGFPSLGALNRLKSVNSIIYQTDKTGSIRVIISDGKIKIAEL